MARLNVHAGSTKSRAYDPYQCKNRGQQSQWRVYGELRGGRPYSTDDELQLRQSLSRQGSTKSWIDTVDYYDISTCIECSQWLDKSFNKWKNAFNWILFVKTEHHQVNLIPRNCDLRIGTLRMFDEYVADTGRELDSNRLAHVRNGRNENRWIDEGKSACLQTQEKNYCRGNTPQLRFDIFHFDHPFIIHCRLHITTNYRRNCMLHFKPD